MKRGRATNPKTTQNFSDTEKLLSKKNKLKRRYSQSENINNN